FCMGHPQRVSSQPFEALCLAITPAADETLADLTAAPRGHVNLGGAAVRSIRGPRQRDSRAAGGVRGDARLRPRERRPLVCVTLSIPGSNGANRDRRIHRAPAPDTSAGPAVILKAGVAARAHLTGMLSAIRSVPRNE